MIHDTRHVLYLVIITYNYVRVFILNTNKLHVHTVVFYVLYALLYDTAA